MPRPGQGGRHSKGDRVTVISRAARPLGDAVRQSADDAGMTISDYVATILANVHNMPQHAPQQLSRHQELPLSRSA